MFDLKIQKKVNFIFFPAFYSSKLVILKNHHPCRPNKKIGNFFTKTNKLGPYDYIKRKKPDVHKHFSL